MFVCFSLRVSNFTYNILYCQNFISVSILIQVAFTVKALGSLILQFFVLIYGLCTMYNWLSFIVNLYVVNFNLWGS